MKTTVTQCKSNHPMLNISWIKEPGLDDASKMSIAQNDTVNTLTSCRLHVYQVNYVFLSCKHANMQVSTKSSHGWENVLCFVEIW